MLNIQYQYETYWSTNRILLKSTFIHTNPNHIVII